MALTPLRRALLSLAVGGFGIGTGEFAIFGLLPNVAGDLSVSVPQAGQLIAAYALGVVVGAPVLTIATVRVQRKHLLIGLMLTFALGNALSAIAPSFGLIMLARFCSGLPHGAFFGAGSVVAASMVQPWRRSSAMAVMFTGLTVANVVGVPLTTLAGQHVGWRPVFGLVAVIGLLAALSVLLFVPHVSVGAQPSVRNELRTFTNVQVWLTLGITVFGGAGLFATFSYIAPMMTNIAGYAESSVTWMMMIFGLGMTVGNLLGARLADRLPTGSIYIALGCEVCVALLFLLTAHNKITAALTIFLFPATSLAMLPALQNRMIHLGQGAPNLASASIQGAFNVANSLGAWLGGLTIAAGFGYGSPNVVAAAMCAIGLLIALLTGWVDRRVGSPVRASAPEREPLDALAEGSVRSSAT